MIGRHVVQISARRVPGVLEHKTRDGRRRNRSAGTSAMAQPVRQDAARQYTMEAEHDRTRAE